MATETKQRELSERLAYAVGHYLANAPEVPLTGGVYPETFNQLHRAYESYCAARPVATQAASIEQTPISPEQSNQSGKGE